MDKQKYASALQGALYKEKTMRHGFWLAMVSNLLLAWFVLTADTTEKTILMPPEVIKPFSIQGDKASPEYIEQMVSYMSQLRLTYQRANVQYQFDAFLKYAHPAVYSQLKTQLDLEVDRIRRNEIASVFYPQEIFIQRGKVYVTGELRGYIGSQLLAKKQRTYEFGYEFNGKFMITSFNEVRQNSTGDFERVEQQSEVLVEQEEVESE